MVTNTNKQTTVNFCGVLFSKIAEKFLIAIVTASTALAEATAQVNQV